MPDLIAQGQSNPHRWRRPLPESSSGHEIIVGRAESDWNVPWDAMISRRHVRLRPLPDGYLEVIRNPTARNPVYYRGNQSTHFKLAIGEHFVIGETTFTFVNRPGAFESRYLDADRFVSEETPAETPVIGQTGFPSPRTATNLTEHAYDHQVLQRRRFRDAESRIEILSRLPDLITSSETDEELLVRMTNVLLQATPSAIAVAVIEVAQDPSTSAASSTPAPVQVLHYDSRRVENDDRLVSARLARSAIEKRESLLHIWSGQPTQTLRFTSNEGIDWAFCVPLRSEACRGWAIYVTGQLASRTSASGIDPKNPAPEELQDDVKFAELVGSMVANLRQSHRLERRQASMRQFFAPLVMDALARRDPDEVLAPREANLAVLFCDLRGFSRQSEEQADHLLELLGRVSQSLGVMTRAILDSGGVIGDFHGDAAMGFWGWPLAQSDMAIRAANAAMQIRAKQSEHATALFQHGIGIASGRAVAGRIGTTDQVKVTAFGPVVNLASRLEGLTKVFGVHVIIDHATADAIARTQPDSLQTRLLATVRPAGFTRPTDVYQLRFTSPEPESGLTIKEVQVYEQGLREFNAGRWSEATRLLQELQHRDRPSAVLLQWMTQHQNTPPADWSGVINLTK